MRNPNDVLKSLQSNACKEDYKYKRLYRNLYNADFFLKAYQNIYAKEGNMTAGTDGKTIDGMGTERIQKIIESLKNHSYQPKPARRKYIRKKNSNKKRPLGIPSADDKLVQEVVRMLLESIYEPTFSKFSHGFRPNRSCHTAMIQIKANFTGVTWFIEGDIKGFFDNIDHHTLINILRKRIHDEYFISLIWKFLKAGYIEDWKYVQTFSGTPQGSIISPILANIYLNEFDKYMEKYMSEFRQGKRRKTNPEYIRYRNKAIRHQVKKMSENEWKSMSKPDKTALLKDYRKTRNTMLKIPQSDLMDDNYKRLFYVRYADDWLCGVIGSKSDTEKIKADIKEYLQENLKLSLSEEKTLITNGQKKAKFLGYEVFVSNDTAVQKTARGFTQRVHYKNLMIYVPREKWQNKLIELGVLKLKYHKGQNYKEVFEPVHRTKLINCDDIEIVKKYNTEIRGMYNYYRIADNASVLNNFYYVMKFSMLKTFAAKYKSNIGKIRNKYGHQRFGVKYQTKNGGENIMYFYDEGFKKNKTAILQSNVDIVPIDYSANSKTSLVERIKAEKCEICGKENVPIEIHHVRKLKDLKGKSWWERFMISRRRKTMALCKECHDDLHAGRLD